MWSKFLNLTLVLTVSSFSFSQIIGGSGNSEMSPKEAEPSTLSAGEFGGQVNTVNGGFNASINLGAVSTPGGISFSLNLGYSSTFAVGNTQPMTEGIPYGEGWGPNIPTISVETDVLQKFTCYQLSEDGEDSDNLLNYNKGSFKGDDQGDLYWFAPILNIPGVGSGRAVFKYIDEDDSKCMVFVLNKFENPIEIRYYGNRWKIILQDGTVYSMGVHLVNYRAPANDRIIFYNQDKVVTDPTTNKLKQVVDKAQSTYIDPYEGFRTGVQNVIEPKISYSVWYCTNITNPNIPLQGVIFEYEKYGEFNFFKEFLQENYGNVKTETFYSSSLVAPNDYSAFRDVILTKVSSYVHESKVDIIDLEYKTNNALADNGIIRNPDDSDVTPISNLYNKTIEASYGTNGDDFGSWTRYVHHKRDGSSSSIHPDNPYLNSSNYFQTEPVSQNNEAAFSHGFLESERLFKLTGDNIYPGDIYEINTVISRNNQTDLSNGNGTVDIAVVTGTLFNSPHNESNIIGSSVSSSNQHFQSTKGVELFSTFNRAFKWTMGYNSSELTTSNAFVMPNFPSSYQGLNIQVGPGNSDINYASHPITNERLVSSTGEVNAINAYPFEEGPNGNGLNPTRQLASTNQIGHNFGTGHPWSMMIPIYNMMTLNSSDVNGAPYTPDDLYTTWWSDDTNPVHPWEHPNKPTKFDANVKLEKVELIRYSKNAYMLNAVKVYKVNGEFSSSSLANEDALQLVSQKKFEFEKKEAQTIKNYDYSEGDQIRYEPMSNRKRIIILLKAVRNIPTSGDVNLADYGVNDTSTVQTTFLGYKKLLDNQNSLQEYNDTLPFIGITKYVLNRYVDHLGGITEVDYYSIQSGSPSAGGADYTPARCGAISTPSKPMGARSSYTVHPVVKYLAKNNEGDFLTQPNSGPLPNSGAQVWHYKYDWDDRITFSESFSSMDVRNHIPLFRGDFRNRTDVAFSQVEVEGPKLNTGERTTTKYSYFGDPNQDSAIDAYLFFGKPKSVETYDANGVLESEKLYEYGYTKAFSNAYERPNPVKENLNYQNQIISSYEYEDIYLDDPFNVTLITGIDTIVENGVTTIYGTDTLVHEGTEAYSYISNDALNGTGKPQEYPKFFTFHFYDEFKSVFPEHMFHSYFIKTASITERVYENGLSKNVSYDPIPADPVFLPVDNPHGTGLSNPVTYTNAKIDLLINLIETKDETSVGTILMNESPLGDTILNYLINHSNLSTPLISDVLTYQNGLTNDVFNNLITKRKYYSHYSLGDIVEEQPYFSDSILRHLIAKLDTTDNYKIVEAILSKNDSLSTGIILALTEASSSIPASTYRRVIRNQGQQPYSALAEIITHSSANGFNLEKVLLNQRLNDSLYTIIIDETSYDNEVITSIIESNAQVPSDAVLTLLLNQSVLLSENQVTRVFSVIDRPIGAPLINLLYQLYEPILVDFIIGNQLNYHCDNELIEGRTYIETKKEFDYYEANFEGKAIGKAYEMLFGFIGSTDEPSAFPMTLDVSNYSNKVGISTKEVNNIYLKHEPSWQLFSVKSSSPHLPGAYTKNEKYYLYDLQNRYDRHWYLHDLNSFNYWVDVFTENEYEQPFGGNDTLALNILYWPQNGLYYPEVPSFDGMNKSREYNNKTLVFQDVSFSKNPNGEHPVMNAKYYRHDSRWSFNYDYESLDGGDVYYAGDACSTPGGNADCNEIECTDCYEIYPTGGQTYDDLVPIGYCLWYTSSGQFVCPQGVDLFEHGFDSNIAHLEWCNEFVESDEDDDEDKMMPIPDLLSKTLQLRSVYVQLDTLDHSPEQTFDASKWDQNNQYVAEFSIDLNTANLDEYGFEEPYEIIPPFENMRTNHILERSNYFQPALEENQIGLQTKYYYSSPKRINNINSNCTSEHYLSMLNENIGLPVRICVGYNKLDSLSTAYSYNDIGQIENIVSPDGQSLSYEYDDYNRLIQNVANNERQLNQYEYSYWQHDFDDWFEERTDQNYVKTTLFNSDPTVTGNELDKEIQKGFIDPLGRSFSKVSAYFTSASDRVEIHSGTVAYDDWNRKFKKYKNYVVNNFASNPINTVVETSTPFEEVVFEKSPKSRSLRSSNYGLDVQGTHAIKNEYYIANYIYTSCELGLSKYELNLIMRSSTISNFRFYRSVTFDQDDKKTIAYSNASGQKVATLQYGENQQKIVTLFVYDEYGNLTKTINPEKQETDYIYNSLGLMVEEKTVDAGATKFMYNKQGLVSLIRNTQTDDFNNGHVQRYTRKMHYDDFGRLIKVERRNINEDHLFDGKIYDGFYYKDELIGAGIDQPISTPLHTSGEFYFEYKYTNISSLDWLNQYKILWETQTGGTTDWFVTEQNQEQLTNQSVPTKEKEYFYSEDVLSNKIGKLESTMSYNASGTPIQRTDFTYDAYGNIAEQEITFNPSSPVGNYPANDKVAKIEYPAYNYRGSLLEEKVDVNNDGTVDFHCFMDYDPLNRLVGIYASIGEVANQTEASLVVSYAYNDAIGTIDKKTHYIEDKQLIVIANEISYTYDERNRLTNITAKKPGFNPIMDYDLLYDDQVTQYNYGGQTETVVHDQNWNGNINGTSMKYNFNSMDAFAAAPNNIVKPLVYGFTYDPINRMTHADAIVGDFLQTGTNAAESHQVGDLTVSYDKIGNITSLHRTLLNDDTSPGAPYLAFDHFNYTYGNGNNHLLAAQGASGSATRNYQYDEVGNLLTDDARNITSTAYSRTAYPFTVTLFENEFIERIDYLYSVDDQRIYKKHTDDTGVTESYYLRDAFGKTVAIYSKKPNEEKWSYFVSGAERECEITPEGDFTPFTNSGVNHTFDKLVIGVEISKFYLYDHLGNTRVTYSPDEAITTPERVLKDEFLHGSFDGWQGEENPNIDMFVDVSNTANALDVTVTPQLAAGVFKEIDYLHGGQFAYEVTIDVDLGTTNGLEMSITNALPNTQTLTQGVNTFTITPSSTSSVLSILPTDQSQTHNFTINSITIEKVSSTVWVTKDDITQVVDYYPYGKILREYVLGDQERYLTTQHERDQVTGLDYRGARYYDADVARFLSLDPLAAQFPGWSAYNYVMGNPVMLVDPDGRAPQGDYYNDFGKYLGSDEKNDDKVYLADGVIKNNDGKVIKAINKIELSITHSEFKDIAGTIYAEGTPWNLTFEEAAGIYSVMRNRADASDKSVHDIASGGGIYGWSEKDKINSTLAHSSSVKNALKGTIEGLTNSKDYSGGGFYWHGTDFEKPTRGSRAHESFYKVGFKFTNSSHDIWGLGNNKSGKSGWDYKYQSTGTGGQTTFMKLTDEWIKANKHTGLW